MTKLEGEHYPSINRQGRREESIQGHLFHKNFFYLSQVVIRFHPQQTLLPRGNNDFENNKFILSLKNECYLKSLNTSAAHGVIAYYG